MMSANHAPYIKKSKSNNLLQSNSKSLRSFSSRCLTRSASTFDTEKSGIQYFDFQIFEKQDQTIPADKWGFNPYVPLLVKKDPTLRKYFNLLQSDGVTKNVVRMRMIGDGVNPSYLNYPEKVSPNDIYCFDLTPKPGLCYIPSKEINTEKMHLRERITAGKKMVQEMVQEQVEPSNTFCNAVYINSNLESNRISSKKNCLSSSNVRSMTGDEIHEKTQQPSQLGDAIQQNNVTPSNDELINNENQPKFSTLWGNVKTIPRQVFHESKGSNNVKVILEESVDKKGDHRRSSSCFICHKHFRFIRLAKSNQRYSCSECANVLCGKCIIIIKNDSLDKKNLCPSCNSKGD